MLFGLENELVLMALFAVVIFVFLFEEEIKALWRKKTITRYEEGDWRNSNAVFHYGGRGGKAYSNLRLSGAPFIEANGKATIPLEGLDNPLMNVNISEDDPDSNIRIKADPFGLKTRIYCNIDAANHPYEWDNILVDNYDRYVERAMADAEKRVRLNRLRNKELEDKEKGVEIVHLQQTRSGENF